MRSPQRGVCLATPSQRRAQYIGGHPRPETLALQLPAHPKKYGHIPKNPALMAVSAPVSSASHLTCQIRVQRRITPWLTESIRNCPDPQGLVGSFVARQCKFCGRSKPCSDSTRTRLALDDPIGNRSDTRCANCLFASSMSSESPAVIGACPANDHRFQTS